MVLSNKLSCEARSFSHSVTPTGFTARGFETLFPHAGTLGYTVCLAPQLFLPVYPHANVGPWPASFHLTTQSASCCLAACPLHPSCPSAPLLPVWMNVSSLTPWLSGFHIVQFSGSSGWLLFFTLLLSIFWLCKEAKCIYLHFHLGWKLLFSLFGHCI